MASAAGPRGPGWSRSIGFRVAVAALGTAALAVGIVTLGVIVVGADTFAQLMVEHGSSAESAHAMFDQSITLVLAVAVVSAIVVAIVLAMALGRRLARPIDEIGAAARAIAAGDYGARVPRSGPEELAGLADSFNQMAASLEAGELVRREFIANAAHELRTPLTNLKGYLEGLRDGVIPGDDATYRSLSEEVERLVRLAASLDTLADGDARTTPTRIVTVDLVAAVRTAADLAAPGLDRAGIALGLTSPTELSARADPDGLAQILGNLLQNAERYTPAGGRVLVDVEPLGREARVSMTNTPSDIPGEDLAHVFERFYRVDKSRDRAHGGAGIGLAIVRQLVESAGGRVGAESADGLTRVWFSLPRPPG
jgi:two-component system, OmpR family, sensor histidine kinase BaeS